MAERETGAILSLVEICTVPVSDSDRPNERPTEEGGTDRRGAHAPRSVVVAAVGVASHSDASGVYIVTDLR